MAKTRNRWAGWRAPACLFVVLALVGGEACAPGLAGQWKAAGGVHEGDGYYRFSGTLDVDDKGNGLLTATLPGSRPSRMRVCGKRSGEQDVVLVVDLSDPPSRSCESIRAALTLRGVLGADTLAGEVSGVDGSKVGLWRALRKEE